MDLYPDGVSAYVVGATYETADVDGELVADGEETVELAWFSRHRLPEPMTDFNRRVITRGLAAADRLPQR